MTTLVMGAIGAAVGFVVSGGNPWGARIGWTAGVMIGAAMDAPDIQGPRLADLRVTTNDYGSPIPWLTASPRVTGDIIWASEKRETAHEEGKGGPSSTSYTYDCDLLIMLAENQIPGISRIWINNELIFNSGETKEGTWSDIAIYNGTDTQLPDPTYEAAVGIDNAPAYRGRAYVVISGLQLGNSGVIPNISFEIGVSHISTNDPIYSDTNIYSCVYHYRKVGTKTWIFEDMYDASMPFPYTYPATIRILDGTDSFESVTKVPALSTRIAYGPGGYSLGETSNYFYLFGKDVLNNSKIVRVSKSDITSQTVYSVPYDTILGYQSHNNDGLWIAYNNGVDAIDWALFDYSTHTITETRLGAPINADLPWDIAMFQAEQLPNLDIVYVVARNNNDLSKRTLVFLHPDSSYDLVPLTNTFDLYPAALKYAGDNILWVLMDGSLTKVNTSTLSVIDTYTVPQDSGGYKKPACLEYNETDKRLYWLTASNPDTGDYNDSDPFIITFDTVSNSIIKYERLPPNRLETDPGVFDYLYEIKWLNGRLWCSAYLDALGGYAVYALYGGSNSKVTNTIDDVISKLMIRAEYAPNDYDVSDVGLLTKPVRGMAIGQISASRGALETLKSTWFFDVVKSDKIYFKRRQSIPVATISWEELGTSERSSDSEYFSLKIANDLELPSQIALTYPNMDYDYNASTEYSDRVFGIQESIKTIQVGVGMTPTEAKQVSDASIFDAIIQQTTVELSLPLQYSYIEPSDIINVVNFDGRSYRLRVKSRTDDLLVLKLACVLDDSAAIKTESVLTSSSYTSVTTVNKIAKTQVLVLDIPILRDVDTSGVYVAVAPVKENLTDEWLGASVMTSTDNLSYSEEYRITEACTIGKSIDASNLGGWYGNVFDETTTVTVTMNYQLSSTLRETLLKDSTINTMLIGEEIIRFRDATLIASTDFSYTYVLSGLIRGVRGTEYAYGNYYHSDIEDCILLNNSLRRIESQNNQIGMPRYIKAVTYGQIIGSVEGQLFTDTGISLKPFSPTDIRVKMDSPDYNISWHRRTRLSTRYVGPTGISVPLDEPEKYTLKIYKYPFRELKYSVTTTTPNTILTAAMRTAAGLTVGSLCEFEVSQISATVGAGRTGSIYENIQ